MRDSLDAVTLYFHGIKRLQEVSKEELADVILDRVRDASRVTNAHDV